MQSGKYRSPGTCQTQTHLSDCRTEKRDSFIIPENSSPLLESSGFALHLSCCCSQLLPLCYNTTNC
ncbi:unnamed protein product [Staurois parvus]|uniref:Uncharacterized protein n=1 Tax=Staurois parvus TaxID=386267 RepID=A0ABN9AFN7_9NEOB|nr:unnamed protein product [Staurois parvus]